MDASQRNKLIANRFIDGMDSDLVRHSLMCCDDFLSFQGAVKYSQRESLCIVEDSKPSNIQKDSLNVFARGSWYKQSTIDSNAIRRTIQERLIQKAMISERNGRRYICYYCGKPGHISRFSRCRLSQCFIGSGASISVMDSRILNNNKNTVTPARNTPVSTIASPIKNDTGSTRLRSMIESVPNFAANKLLRIKSQFEKVFLCNGSKFGYTNMVEHANNTIDNKPNKQRLTRFSIHKNDEMNPWGSNAVLSKNKGIPDRSY
ncbi:hypothetical protein RF11_03560 [Thelohanellus kitauei]|uniref:CCHC-type domain-containing protein n=1 Tax=Thelohanellus kitauei TaxID=669202 RepID=A0A0C2N5S7_THEKT|nr:hypothetical protein RF11_03560 [Thelohanellus kitauei]